MRGQNTTSVSVFYGDELLFVTASFPVIPEVGERISLRVDDKSQRYTVVRREYIFQKHTDKDERDIFVILHVE